MKKMKWIVLALLTLCLLGSAALAEEAPVWSYDSGNACLRLAGEISGEVTIPAEVDGYPVNAIAGNAFYGQSGITSLTMPDSLRAIQDGAISGMDGLTQVTLNDGLEYIGGNFSSCNALTSVTVPASVRIVDCAFSSCANLKEIRFEGACPMFIGAEWCFFMMPEDYVIYVPDDQLDAYAAALKDANGAADRLQPSGKSAVLPEAQRSEDWFEFDASTGTITGYREYHAYVEIPETIGGVPVKAIGDSAFRGDYSVYAVVFPEGLEEIGAGTFMYASNIAYAQLPSTLKTIGDDAFFNAQIDQIDWSEGLETIGARAFQYDKAAILSLPETVKTIGESAFEGAWCQELYLGGNVTSIGSRAFAGTALNYLAFDLYAPIDIAPDAFAETNVADLDLPWDCSFENRDAYAELLKDQCPDCTVWINNPDSAGVAECPVNEPEITTIEDGVWTVYNGSQADLTVWAAYDDINVTALGDGLFKGSQTIRSFYPHHCGWFTTIGAEAFADSSVETVELFGSITEIGDEAFRNCTNITGLALPESLTTIGSGAFKGCTGLTGLALPESLTTIGSGAFKGCDGITELTLPASLTRVDSGALDGCEHLAKLTVLCDPAILPEDLLANCPALTEVYAAPEATQQQVQALSAMVNRPWYDPVPRVGEPQSRFAAMPDAPLPGDDFWYDEEYSRLDAYQGYELNLILPREIDGVPLTMIGGAMMTRASYGDNFDVELPVVSLVIPENYTEIPAYAFSNCDTLETVICYAPIEHLADGMFSGCTNLREVVFVNGVRSLGNRVFSGCLSLETVYLGACVESVSESAFLDDDGDESYPYEDCITDPAQLPDVDALLAAVKCAPMPTPEPTATPAPARPVGAEGEPFLGTWSGVSMEIEGTEYSLTEFGMVMELTFSADGTVTLFDGEETDAAAWYVEDGAAIVDDMPAVLQPDGTLAMEEDGAKLIFARADGAAQPEPDDPSDTDVPEDPESGAPAPVGAEGEPFLGTWSGVSMEIEGTEYSLTEFGMVMELTFSADGTVTLFDGEETDAATWYVEDGAAIVDGMPAVLQPDGTLAMEEDGAKLIFARTDGAAQPEPGDLPDTDDPEDSDPESGAPAPVGAEGEPFLGTWSGVSMEIEGTEYSLTEFGMVMELTFSADGTVTLFDGEETDAAAWYVEDGAAIVDGVPAVLQPDGTLAMEEDGAKLIFARTDGAAQPEPDDLPGADLPEHPAAEDRLERKYVCVSAEVEGFAMDADMLGAEYSLTFHADGTMDFVIAGTALPGMTWTQGVAQTESGEADAYLVDYYGNQMEAILTEEGFDLNYFDSMLMHFIPEA